MRNSLPNSHKEISVEQKLALIRQVRSQYRQNQNDLMHRESILYDRPLRPYINTEDMSAQDETYYSLHKKEGPTNGPLKFRYAIAVLLTALVILCHRTHISPAGINMEQVFITLEQDYEDAILAWSSSLIQTEHF